MNYGVRVETWGDYALFTRPELRVERVSYDVMTPSAARGLLESIFWKPAIQYVIDKIYVLSPIQHTGIRRNEIKSKANARNANRVMNNPEKGESLYINRKSDIAQRSSLLLQNVHYVIEAHFEMTDRADADENEAKFFAMLRRRLKKGQCFQQPYFGCKEFPAHFRLFEGDDIQTAYPSSNKDLGLMLYDLDYSAEEGPTPMFFRAIMQDGVLDLRDCEVYQ